MVRKYMAYYEGRNFPEGIDAWDDTHAYEKAMERSEGKKLLRLKDFTNQREITLPKGE